MESLGTRLKTTHDTPRQPYIKVLLRFPTHEKIWLSSQHVLFDFPTHSSPLCTFLKSSHTHLTDLSTICIVCHTKEIVTFMSLVEVFVTVIKILIGEERAWLFDYSLLKVLVAWFSAGQRSNCSHIFLIYGFCSSEVTLISSHKGLWTLSLNLILVTNVLTQNVSNWYCLLSTPLQRSPSNRLHPPQPTGSKVIVGPFSRSRAVPQESALPPLAWIQRYPQLNGSLAQEWLPE